MIIVKLTVLLLLATVVYAFLIKAYLAGDRKEAVKVAFDGNYQPKYLIILAIMDIVTTIGIFASAIYLLFFRQPHSGLSIMEVRK